MDETTLRMFSRLGISLAVGMLVGLQREHAANPLAGFRSFALIAIAGTLVALLDMHMAAGGWILASSFIAVGAVVAVSEWQLGADLVREQARPRLSRS